MRKEKELGSGWMCALISRSLGPDTSSVLVYDAHWF